MSHMEKRWAFPLIFTSLIIFILLITSSNVGLIFSVNTLSSIFSIFPTTSSTSPTHPTTFVESRVGPSRMDKIGPPRLAYLVSGSKGDLNRLWRTLLALYHPANEYVVHLDLEAPKEERRELERRVVEEKVFRDVGNVVMITKANMVTYRGPTMVANTLHACAVLLRKSREWDWFINLSASDYPLVTQDDLLQSFSSLPKNVNFVEHTSNLGWKLYHRARPMMIDPGLYLSKKNNIFWVKGTREAPTAFKLFTGSAWMGLTRDFVEFCVWGWDNLPRTLLMYYANFVSSPEGYFQTVICNSPEYTTTVANHDLHYISWDNPPKQHPRVLTLRDMDAMVKSNAPFARKIKGGEEEEALLDKIDSELLGRRNGSFTPGGWCSGDPHCDTVGNPAKLKPGPGLTRLQNLMHTLIRSKSFSQNQCK